MIPYWVNLLQSLLTNLNTKISLSWVYNDLRNPKACSYLCMETVSGSLRKEYSYAQKHIIYIVFHHPQKGSSSNLKASLSSGVHLLFLQKSNYHVGNVRLWSIFRSEVKGFTSPGLTMQNLKLDSKKVIYCS